MRRIPAGALLMGLTVVIVAACQQAPRAPTTEQATQTVAPPLSHSDQLLLAAASIALPPAGVQPGDLPEPELPGSTGPRDVLRAVPRVAGPDGPQRDRLARRDATHVDPHG